MPIPLRELALLLLLVPGAMGFAAGFNRGVAKFDAFLFECDHLDNQLPPSCSQEALLTAWDVQLQLEKDCQKRRASTTKSAGEMTLLAREPL